MLNSDFFSTFYLDHLEKQLFCEKPVYAYIFYKEFRINLLTGEKEDYSPAELFNLLELYTTVKTYDEPLVIHLFYELGFYCIDRVDLIETSAPLAIIVKYKDHEIKKLFEKDNIEHFSLELLSSPNLEGYSEKFDQVYEHLLDGDCYQVNLAEPFYFRMKNEYSPKELISNMWKDSSQIGRFSHGTFIPSLGKLLLTNSPECLFQISLDDKGEQKLSSMPIKGTVPLKDNSKETQAEATAELLNSKKNQAELFMISDLIRNDLSKIEFKPARIEHKKCPLIVPGLVHQFSHLSVRLSPKCNLSKIIRALFPGGSITGAPKKRVMEIIKKLEASNRGFYCGSTILFFKDVKAASINIRSVEVDYIENEIKYGAGGGVTLQSTAKDEYEEMVHKMKSFLLLFKK